MGGRGACRPYAPIDGGRRTDRVRGPRGGRRPGGRARAENDRGGGGSRVTLGGVAPAFSLIVTAFFVLWTPPQIGMSGAAALYLWRDQRRRPRRDRALAARLASRPLVSVIVPA